MAIKTKQEIDSFQKRTNRKLIELEKNLSSDPNYTIPKLKEDPQSLIDTKDLLDELFATIITYKQDYGLKWIKGLERYLADKKHLAPYANYNRGNIVLVELFGHFNSELTFEHPAVVLYDNKNSMLIAPVSTPKYNDNDDLHIDVDESNGFNHPCAILLDSIRVIDKRRIIKVYTKDNSNSNIGSSKLDEIDEILMQNFTPKYYKAYVDLQETFMQEQQSKEEQEIRYNELEIKYNELEIKYKNLETQYKQVHSELNKKENEEKVDKVLSEN